MNNRTAVAYLSQSEIAIEIERLVQAIEDSDAPAFRIRQTSSGYERVERTKLSQYFTHIRQMVDLFDDRVEYTYSEHLQAFKEACQDIGLERHPGGPVCLNERGTSWLDHHHSMNVLTARIRQLTRQQWYRRKSGDRRYQAGQQEIRICDYSDALRQRYSRMTILRVNLYYRSEAQARLRVERVFDDLDQLIAEHELNPIFSHLIGYICAVEQGESRGYHIHAAYFFNGNEKSRDVWRAKAIGALWEDITHGQGYMHSCNQDKDQYGDKCAIGRISRGNQSIRHGIQEMVKYLVKATQHLRLRPKGARCLRTGMFG